MAVLTFTSGTGHFTVANDANSVIEYYPKNMYKVVDNGDDTCSIEEITGDHFVAKNLTASTIGNAGANFAAKLAAVVGIIYA